MILSKIWQKTILNSRYLLPHAPKIFKERKYRNSILSSFS
nr:MAG TPA: hypothetical protein [Caudoviricetes sp.]